MISIEKLQQLALDFKTKRLDEISIEINKHPNTKKSLMHQFIGYEDEKEKYKVSNIGHDYSIVEDDAKEIFKSSMIKNYNEDDLLNLSKELIDVHVQLIDFIEKKSNNSNYCQTQLSRVNEQKNEVKTKQSKISIKEAFDKFIEHKDLVEKVSMASLNSYNSAYKYILLFYKADTSIDSFKSIDFKNMQKDFLKLPKNALNNKSSTELMTNHSVNKYFQIYKGLFDYLD